MRILPSRTRPCAPPRTSGEHHRPAGDRAVEVAGGAGQRRPLARGDRIFHFLRDGLHDPAYLDEALALWNELRAKLQAQSEPEQSDRFFVFTKVVADQLPIGERKRAVLETAAELLPHASDRHVMYARLARLAINEQELAAAAAWLKLCDPHSVVIEADTEYRLTRASLSLART